jgi:ferritin-like metal-binding protein YciE
MKIENMQDLLLDQIKDLYDAEQRLVKALPGMALAASSPELRKALLFHLQETKIQVERLERIFELMGQDAEGQVCPAMKGLIEQGKLLVSGVDEPALRDAGLVAAANRMEHYEMATYGSARTFARTLGMTDVASLLQETLDEERRADATLTKLAETEINDQAMAASQASH